MSGLKRKDKTKNTQKLRPFLSATLAAQKLTRKATTNPNIITPGLIGLLLYDLLTISVDELKVSLNYLLNFSYNVSDLDVAIVDDYFLYVLKIIYLGTISRIKLY